MTDDATEIIQPPPARVDEKTMPMLAPSERHHGTEWPRGEDGQGEGTWLDLTPLGSPERDSTVLIGRDELLERLRAYGYEISERSLRSWEAMGILPRPIRRWQEEGSRSAARVLYPEWALDVVAMASELKAKMKGADPSQIRFHLIWHAHDAMELSARGPLTGVVTAFLSPALNKIVRGYEWREGETPRVMEVRLLNADGVEVHTQTVGL